MNRRVLKYLVARAREASLERRYQDAAALYAEAVRLAPDRAGLHVQRGHMLKEAGELAEAETSYLQAQRLTPDDPDLALQLGHFYKVAGRLADAQQAYERALSLK